MFIDDGSVVLFLLSAKGKGGGPDGKFSLGACIVSPSGFSTSQTIQAHTMGGHIKTGQTRQTEHKGFTIGMAVL
jgi:hypothetical protein